MLQYYTLMRMKNKIKDFEEKYEEWWEVVEEYFTKEMENNLAQHRADENILKQKLEAYQKKKFKFHPWESNKYKGIRLRRGE